MDRKKADSMSDGSNACQKVRKECVELLGSWDKVEKGRTKDTTLLGIDSRECMVQVLVLAFGLFGLLWLALIFGIQILTRFYIRGKKIRTKPNK